MAASLIAGAAGAQANGPAALIQSALGDGQRFGTGALRELAQSLSKRPYQAPATDLPDPFGGLTYERYVGIRGLPSSRIWDGEGRGFVAEPLLRGFVFQTPVSLFTVEDGLIRRTVFDRSRYDFGSLNLPQTPVDPGFSGMRLEASGAGSPPFQFALIQGATFFRAVAKGQNFGIVARGLALRPADAKGEEFPSFRALWVERPNAGTNAITLHGLVDSESVTGVVRMTFRPGETTIVDVETTLFPRVHLDHVGLGGMAATFLFGPNVRQTTDDVRSAVQEVSGLSILNGQGEWIWRPMNNPDSLQISAFLDENPKGFGLLQRDRDFSFFQDDIQHFERRPSLWIEPIGDWQQGAVQLIEIPSDAEVNKNILAYWRPKAVMQAGSEVTLAYRQFWSWTPPERPKLGIVSATRSGRGSGNRRRKFIVEFTGEPLGVPLPELKVTLTAAPGSIPTQRVWTYPDRKMVRVIFELDYGSETACEMRLALQSGGTPLSETWLYRWTP